jgi:hypothetical protein
VQVAAGVAEHDPRRRLARATRNGYRGRLPRRQYRLEPLDRGFLRHALLGGHRHMEAVGLVDVGDQGGGVAGELRPMGGHGSCASALNLRPPQVNISAAWTVTAPAMASAAAARRAFMSFLAIQLFDESKCPILLKTSASEILEKYSFVLESSCASIIQYTRAA